MRVQANSHDGTQRASHVEQIVRFDEVSIEWHFGEMIDDVIAEIRSSFPIIYFAAHTHHHPSGAEYDQLSGSDYRLIVHIDAMPTAGTQQLANHLNLQTSTVSEGLGRLEKMGLIRKIKDAKDQRRRRFGLTEVGQQRLSSDSVLDADLLRQILTVLTDVEVADVGRVFSLLKRAVTERKQD